MDIWEKLMSKRPTLTTLENMLISALREVRNMVPDKDQADEQIKIVLLPFLDNN